MRTNIKTDRCMDAFKLGLFNALGRQPLTTARVIAPGAQRTNVEATCRQSRNQRLIINIGNVGQRNECGMLVKADRKSVV